MGRERAGADTRAQLTSEFAVADFVYEIVLTGDHTRRDAARAWLRNHAASTWLALPDVSAVDIYEIVEDGAKDPFLEPDLDLLVLAMLHFPTLDALATAVTHPRFGASLAAQPHGFTLTGTAFERRFFPVAGETAPGPLRAGFSYVVRYHPPAEDAAHFIAHYLADHPPLMAKLPEIRSILCYLPIRDAAPNVVPAVDYVIGNEVAFDSVDAFNAAMASPARKEMRAHFLKFPPFSGRNTHFPMLRTQLNPNSGGRPS
jgi:uncharacterized protein (TIGR02118 family)